MMEHPITPPPELVQHLADGPSTWLEKIVNAYRAGADQELEACCEWLKAKEWIHPEFSDELRTARRPQPSSLAEEGLALIDKIQGNKKMWQIEELDVVRRALVRLQKLENTND